MNNKVKKCCICGGYFMGWGNNPAPVKQRGECCSSCNSFIVIPARLEHYTRKAEVTKEGGVDLAEKVS